MKLQEVAFMVSLIKANYRRKMLHFWINIVAIFAPPTLLYLFESIKLTYVESVAVFLVFLMIASFVRFFNAYVVPFSVFKEDANFPWRIKKAQMTALREQAEAKADFEELHRCVPLHKYFEMY